MRVFIVGLLLVTLRSNAAHSSGCQSDNDCKAGRVCDAGVCRNKAAAPSQPTPQPVVVPEPAPQPPPHDLVDPYSAGANEEAHGHYKQGKAYFDAKLYDRSIAELQLAYKVAPVPELIFDIAQVLRIKGDLANALTEYQRFLTLASSGSATDRARAYVAELVAAEDERKRRDDAAARSAAEQQEQQRRQQEAMRANAIRQEQEQHAAALRAKSERARTRKRTGYALVGFGAVSFVLAGVFAKLSSDTNDAIANGTLATRQAIKDTEARGQTYNKLGWGTLVLGVASVGIGVPLVVLTKTPSDNGAATTTVSVSVKF